MDNYQPQKISFAVTLNGDSKIPLKWYLAIWKVLFGRIMSSISSLPATTGEQTSLAADGENGNDIIDASVNGTVKVEAEMPKELLDAITARVKNIQV